MSLKISRKHVKRIAKMLDEGGFESAEDAAEALLIEAFALYEDTAKWTVVGQLRYSGNKYLDPEDSAACKIGLGRYGTQKQAEDAADRLIFSTPTGEEFRAWVLPVWHGTPHAYFQKRAEERRKVELAAKSGWEQRLAERVAWHKANPGLLDYTPEPTTITEEDAA